MGAGSCRFVLAMNFMSAMKFYTWHLKRPATLAAVSRMDSRKAKVGTGRPVFSVLEQVDAP